MYIVKRSHYLLRLSQRAIKRCLFTVFVPIGEGYECCSMSVHWSSLLQRGYIAHTSFYAATAAAFSTLCPQKWQSFDLLKLPSTDFDNFWQQLCFMLPREHAVKLSYFLFLLHHYIHDGKTRKHENRFFSLQCCITALTEFNQSLLDFPNFVDLKLIFMLP